MLTWSILTCGLRNLDPTVYSVYTRGATIQQAHGSPKRRRGVDPATQNGGWRKPKNRTQKNTLPT